LIESVGHHWTPKAYVVVRRALRAANVERLADFSSRVLMRRTLDDLSFAAGQWRMAASFQRAHGTVYRHHR